MRRFFCAELTQLALRKFSSVQNQLRCFYTELVAELLPCGEEWGGDRLGHSVAIFSSCHVIPKQFFRILCNIFNIRYIN